VLVRMLEGRVGSTLLMQLLGTSPEIAFEHSYPFENSYLTYLVRLTGRIAASSSKDRTSAQLMHEFVYGDPTYVGPLPFHAQTIDTQAFALASLTAVWHEFSRANGGGARLYAEKFWGDVTPVIDAGLDPIVIDLIRDPRDVVASMRAFKAKIGRALFESGPAETDEKRLVRTVLGMQLRLSAFSTELPVSHLLVRYEDLVNDLPGETARLSEILGTRLDPAVVVMDRADMSGHMTSPSVEHSVGRWTSDLSAHDVRVIEGRLGDRMVSLGYQLSNNAS
jgi:hypothetical protein